MSNTKKSSSRPARPDRQKRPRAGHTQNKGKCPGRGASSREDGAIGAAQTIGTAINGAATISPDPQTYVTVSGREWRIHALAMMMPRMADADFERFKESIRAIGKIRTPIIVNREDEVLDGRHRLRACFELGLEPAAEVCEDGQSYVDLVLDCNDRRRHLTSSQKALVAAKLATLGRGRPGENAQIRAFSQEEAAEKLGVSRTQVQAARNVVKEGIPGLVELVEAGKLSVSAAACVAAHDRDSQEAVVGRGVEAIRQYAAQKSLQTRRRRHNDNEPSRSEPRNAESPTGRRPGGRDIAIGNGGGGSAAASGPTEALDAQSPDEVALDAPRPIAEEALREGRLQGGGLGAVDGDVARAFAAPSEHLADGGGPGDRGTSTTDGGDTVDETPASESSHREEPDLDELPLLDQLDDPAIYIEDAKFCLEAQPIIADLRRLAERSASFRTIRETPAWTKWTFIGAVARFLMIPHLRDWKVCEKCKGRVRPGQTMDCALCGGAGHQYQ